MQRRLSSLWQALCLRGRQSWHTAWARVPHWHGWLQAKLGPLPRWLRLLLQLPLWLCVTHLGFQCAANLAFALVENSPVRETRLFIELRRIGFSWLIRAPSAPDLPFDYTSSVVVVDISRLTRVDETGRKSAGDFTPVDDYTPRKPLALLIKRLANEFDASVIGIDIDFSPTERFPADQDLLLEECLRLFPDPSALGKANVPVFLGVGQASSAGSGTGWLGDRLFRHLAASILLFTEESRIRPPVHSLIPSHIRAARSSETLVSLSQAMAAALQHRHPGLATPQPPGFLRPFVQHGTDLELAGPKGTIDRVRAFDANYALLGRLRQHTYDAEEILSAEPALAGVWRDRLSGRAVLIGAADPRRTADKIIIPGERLLVPGVYAHACGLATLLESPLWRPRPTAELVAGFLISLAGGAAAMRLAPRVIQVSRVRSELWSLTGALAAIAFAAFVFGVALNLLWLGAVAAAFGSCLETAAKLWIFEPSPPSVS